MQKPGLTDRVLSYDVGMSKKPKIETKTVKLYMGKVFMGHNDAKKLVKLQQDGWEILEKRGGSGLFGGNTGYVTYTLVRQKMSKRERAKALSA